MAELAGYSRIALVRSNASTDACQEARAKLSASHEAVSERYFPNQVGIAVTVGALARKLRPLRAGQSRRRHRGRRRGPDSIDENLFSRRLSRHNRAHDSETSAWALSTGAGTSG